MTTNLWKYDFQCWWGCTSRIASGFGRFTTGRIFCFSSVSREGQSLREVPRQNILSVSNLCFSHTNWTLIIDRFPQFSEIFCHIGSAYLLCTPIGFDPTESSLYLFAPYCIFCGARWSPLWLTAGVSHLVFVVSLSVLLRLSIEGLFFRIGICMTWESNNLCSAGQAVFPSASHVIATNKESSAGDSADNFFDDAWRKRDYSCSSTGAVELW